MVRNLNLVACGYGQVVEEKNDNYTPPPDRKNFKSEQEYNKAYKEWKKMFDSAMKNTEY